jgi:hypothetical protein
MSKTRPDKKGLGRLDQLPRAVYHYDGQQGQKSHSTDGKSQESWPTPTAMSRPRSEETMAKCLKFRKSKGKNSVPLYLEEKVQNWPTPREAMSRDVDHDRGKGNLGEKVQSKGMKLNPNWVEQLMGLPAGWTQLPTEWID